jgi:hypothetical protein
MIEPQHDLSVRRQCELLKLARSGIYFQPTPEAEEDLAICKESGLTEWDRKKAKQLSVLGYGDGSEAREFMPQFSR